MTRRSQALVAVAVAIAISAIIPGIAAAQVNGTGLRGGLPDKAAMAYVTRCLGVAPPRPVALYSRGGWYISDDLNRDLHERQGSIEAIAMVWKLNSRPRAVYQWNHDDEFNRDVVACLDGAGKVTRSESKYTPGDSEPDQRWVYIHTLTTVGHPASLTGSGRFTDRDGHPRGRPNLTQEDQDFIAGERVYHRWTDFDFAGAVDAHDPHKQE